MDENIFAIEFSIMVDINLKVKNHSVAKEVVRIKIVYIILNKQVVKIINLVKNLRLDILVKDKLLIVQMDIEMATILAFMYIEVDISLLGKLVDLVTF